MKDRLIPEADALAIDITPDLYQDILVRLKTKQLINWQIRGEVASGKSTLCSHFMYYTNQMLGNRNIMLNANKYIFSDQIEFLRFIKTDMKNIAIQIDEDNRMKDTGYNATRETTLFNYYSDVFAQKYVHRFSACPANIVDINAYLILDVLANNMKGVTKVKVMYRDITNPIPCILGCANIDVKQIMEMPWYKKYRKKKFKRMELLQKEGLSDIREPEYSYLTLKLFKQLKEISKIQRPDSDIIAAELESLRRQEGRQYSMPTEDLIVKKARVLMGLYYKLNQAHQKLNKLTEKSYSDFAPGLHKTIEIMERLFNDRIKEEERMAKIYKEFVNMN